MELALGASLVLGNWKLEKLAAAFSRLLAATEW
jgi:hypothetical protein